MKLLAGKFQQRRVDSSVHEGEPMRPTAVGRRVRLALVGLGIAAVVATTLPGQQAAADHTPVPDTVTLVGSLQSELGCPGDWQPEWRRYASATGGG
jgi:hypothetical protein